MNNQTSDTTKGLLNLGLIGATIYGGVKIIDKIFGDKVRKNPKGGTKTQINNETTVRHISGNNYSYQYNTVDGRDFTKDGLDSEVILTEESKLGPSSWIAGYAENKKEFVDVVYDSVHTNRI